MEDLGTGASRGGAEEKTAFAILGLETEYGVLHAGHDPLTQALDPIALSEAVIKAVDGGAARFDLSGESPLVDARGLVVSRATAHPDLLTDEVTHTSRMLANGGRSYVDHAHPEWSGPEVSSAHEALVWDRAGDRLHREAAARASELLDGTIHLVKNTTDNKGRSYGCHENYLVPRSLPFERVVEQFTSFLVSRVVITGAGRVGLGQRGEEAGFQLSQRADFLERLVGLETTIHRPIINTRDEPHADGREHRRVHVITGDANLCQMASLVKVGSAQLALVAITRGARLPRLLDPLAAVRAYSRDCECRIAQPCEDGVARTAVEIQRLWWEAAREVVDDALAIRDAAEVLAHWGEVLDDLAVDPRRCADRLDWAAKLRLLEGLRERYGCGWEDPRLLALDLRYADLTAGLFERLEGGGAVRRLVDEGEVTQAMGTPPPSTRAWLRGTLLGRFEAEVVAANWDRIGLSTPRGPRTVELTSPLLGDRAHWQESLAGVHEMGGLLGWGDSIGWTTEPSQG